MSVRLLRGSLAALAICLLHIGISHTASAQVRRYRPRTPTISPYLNLTRPNFGTLPNYYAFVRPEFDQQAFNQREQALRQQQAGALRRLTNDVQQGIQPAAPTGTGSWFMQPGTRSRFQNTSRYYSNSATAPPR